MGNWGRRRKESRISIYKSKAPADNGTLRRGTTSDERKARPCWRFHCPAWWSNSQENMQINYLQRLTRKLRLVPENSSATAVDFRYAPRLSQATICFPDNPKKPWWAKPASCGTASQRIFW